MSQIIPIYIPTYINSAEYSPARVLPRLFFYNGMVECETYWIESGSADFGGVTFQQNAFPYFDNYNVVSGSFPSENSNSLLFTNETAAYGVTPNNSLYTNYWSTYINLLYNPKTRLLNCSAIIPLADYFKMELNDIVNFRGNYYHLRAINDYSLKTGECNLQLLGPLIPNTFSEVEPTPDCSFGFTSSLVTTTTTGAPTTTTTIAPTTTTTTTESPFLTIEYLIIAGGGGGSNDNFAGREAYAAGGGAGGYISGSRILSGSNSLNVVVGTGGTAGTFGGSNNQSGTNSSLLSLTAIGGGFGGRQSGTGVGGNGGSGGGGYGSSAGGNGTAGQGFNGNSGAQLVGANLWRGGNGGGASSAPYDIGDLGARKPGLSKAWLDGFFYSSGGKGAGSNDDPENPGQAGNGGTGASDGVGTAGQNGIVKIRYAGTPRATGGSIFESGSYTYHQFASNGTFTWNAPTTTTTTTAGPTTTLSPANVYRAIGCCDSASYYVGWTDASEPIGATLYNPTVNQCMTIIQQFNTSSISFTINYENKPSYVYGYGDDQCNRCITLRPAPCPTTTTTTTAGPTTTTTTSTTTTSTTTAGPSFVYRAVGCCDPSSSYYVGWTYTASAAIPATIYNPIADTCMTLVENVSSQSVSFTITFENRLSNVYGYGDDQCNRCAILGTHICSGSLCNQYTFQNTNLTTTRSVYTVDCTGNAVIVLVSPSSSVTACSYPDPIAEVPSQIIITNLGLCP